MNSLTVYVLCHNRPDFASQAIHSVIKQSESSFRLVVSDNSNNDAVEQMVKREFPAIHYVRRVPMLSPVEHFNRCIEEVETEYFCLFHDDDIMENNYVDQMLRCINLNPDAVAYGCNAGIERTGRIETKLSFQSIQKFLTFKTPRDLARRYFARGQSGVAPYPGYIYNRRQVGELRLTPDAGKYGDVTWLLRLAMKAPIVWINQQLMIYRMHEGGDSNTESLRDRLRFLGFLKKNRNLFGSDLLNDYRFFIYKKIQGKVREAPDPRFRITKVFMRSQRCRRYLRWDFYKSMTVRALNKWFS